MLLRLFLVCALMACPARAGQCNLECWQGRGISDEWLSARDQLDDRGLKITGRWRGAFYGIVESENGQRGVFDEEIVFAATLDLAKLTGFDSLKGLSAFGETR
jgi:carbohydrate-selective porin OprB